MDTVVVEGIDKSYGSVHALRGLTVSFPPGAVGLLGPNGAGKSTLLKVLLGLLPPDSGSAKVLGIDVAAEPMEVRRAVGYMPEVDAYLPGLTGAQSVLFAGVLCGLPRRESQRRAHEILYYVGLGEARYRKVDQYSTGMRQRLRLAQALVHDPELIFLDEPTNGLDPKGRDEVLQLIADLATSHGKSVILCSHLLPDVEHVCKHVVVLREGKVATQGDVNDIRRLEAGTFRVRVDGDRAGFLEILAKAGASLKGEEDEMLVVRLREGDGPRLLFRAAAASGCVVRELSSSEQSLEGAFIRAVEGGPSRSGTAA
jgi:ABC-2 type transport system ATP-binding protein